MNLVKATMSGVNEMTDIRKLLEIMARYRFAEIGVQVNENKCNFGSRRYNWLHGLVVQANYQHQAVNAALHINPSWVEEFGQGYLVPELQQLLSLRNCLGNPFFGRIQLNFKVGRDRTPDIYRMFQLMQNYSTRRFILSYNDANAEIIEQIRDLSRGFAVGIDLLFDDSHGEGIAPAKRKPIVYKDWVQGYAGGIGPHNVETVLDEIARLESKRHSYAGITIDAECKLKCSEGYVDLDRCIEYLQAVEYWMRHNP